jgi:VanZ family protein
MSARARSALGRSIAPLGLMGAIFWFSAQPGVEGLDWWEEVSRKVGHVCGYALLTGLWSWALRDSVRRPVTVAAAISLAYAATDEYHQTFIDGRHGTPVDVGIDAIGISLAALAISARLLPGTKSSPAR